MLAIDLETFCVSVECLEFELNLLVVLMLESVMPRSSRVLSMSISRPSFVNEQVNWESASLSPHPPAVVSGG